MTSTLRTFGPRVPVLQVLDASEPALRAAYLRIREDFPTAPGALVEALMLEAFERTRDARIDAFRVVLAEREARSRLRRVCSHTPSS